MNRLTANRTLSVAVQLTLMAVAAFFAVRMLVERGNPKPYSKDIWADRKGFAAISFGGLSREDDGKRLVTRERFARHLEALSEAGFTAIGVDEIEDFYYRGASLPSKALFIMFEGGRKDSAIFGQEALWKTGMRATMFVQTSLNSRWQRTYLNRPQIATLGKSAFWDVGCSGHELHLDDADPDSGAPPPYFMVDYRRDGDGRPVEDLAEYAKRVDADLSRSADIVRTLADKEPAAFLFQPSNTLGNSMEPELSEACGAIIEKRFPLAFTREGPAFNSRAISPHSLTRMRVDPDATPEELVRGIGAWMPSDRDYVYNPADAGTRWQVETGRAEYGRDSLSLASGADRSGFAWLRGSDTWRNLTLDAGLRRLGGVEQSIYLRFLSRESFLRVTLTDDMLRVMERVPGRGLSLLLEERIDGDADATALALVLRNKRLRISVDGKAATPYPIPISVEVGEGKVAFEVRGATRGTDAAGALVAPVVRPLSERWLPASPGGGDPEASSTFTGLIVPVAGGGREIPAALLRADGDGVAVFGKLPKGSFDLELLARANAALPRDVRLPLWTGVIFSPDSRTNPADMARAVEAARDAGLQAALEVGPEDVEKLARTTAPTLPDWVLVDAPSLPDDARIALSRRCGRILFRNGSQFREE